MFDDFRKDVKKIKSNRKLTYAQLVAKTVGLKEQAVKAFMCGANDSRRIAEKIADALGMGLYYSNGIYKLEERKETKPCRSYSFCLSS